MRKLVLVLAAAAALAAAPASAAGPAVHVVVVDGSLGDVSVTCDTSAYPAAGYPCDFAVVTTGCTDLATGACTLAVRGSLVADPAPSSTGECSFRPAGDWRLTVGTADEPLGVYGVVPRTVVNHGPNGVVTPYVVEVVPLTPLASLPTGNPMAGAIVAGFEFSDLQWDCRTRAGGDPASDTAPDSLPHLAPTGSVVLGRP